MKRPRSLIPDELRPHLDDIMKREIKKMEQHCISEEQATFDVKELQKEIELLWKGLNDLSKLCLELAEKLNDKGVL